jgi:hypothetical protein
MAQEPAFTAAQEEFVAAYMAERKGQEMELDRLVTAPSGLDPQAMMTVLAHPGLEDRGLEVMADYMRPDESMYFDAIFGANYGQRAIRGWLLPTMAEIAFIEFVPQQESALFETSSGAAMIDEWKMIARLDGLEIPLADGISVRRFEDGWMTWVADIYDTMSSRTPPPADAPLPAGMPEPAPLPDYPEMNWPTIDLGEAQPLSDAAGKWAQARLEAHSSGAATEVHTQPSGLTHDELHALHNHPQMGKEFGLIADMMHPTDSVYIDPVFGRFEGQRAIRGWLTDIMGKMGAISFEPISDILWNGDTSVQLWKQVANVPGAEPVEMSWGASVRRFRDGWLHYAADYFDAYSLQKPGVHGRYSQVPIRTRLIRSVSRYSRNSTITPSFTLIMCM